MKRGLLNVATVLSLLLCMNAAVAWGRASAHCDVLRRTVGREAPRTFVEIKSEGSALAVTFMPASDYGAFRQYETGVHPRRWFGYGFDFYHSSYRWGPTKGASPPGVGEYYHVQAPYWALVLVTAALPAWRGWRIWRRERPGRPGVCARCGYDLRATPDRCPECGALPPVQSHQPADPVALVPSPGTPGEG